MMKKLYVLLFVLFSASLFAQTAIEPSGSGTENDPYLIENLENLYWISVESNGGNNFNGNYFLQIDNIDASETENWNNGEGWETISGFRGFYNGNGHIIDGIFINRPEEFNQGLFHTFQLSYQDTNSVIKNLGVTNVDMTVRGDAGAIVGIARDVSILNCFSTGNIYAVEPVWCNIGGIAGIASGGSIIKNCYSRVNVTGGTVIGGILGRGANVIINSYSTGIVDGNNSSSVGGLLGGYYSGNEDRATASFWDIETSGLDNSQGGQGRTTHEMQMLETFANANWNFKGLHNDSTWNIGNNRNDGYPYLNWQYPDDPPNPGVYDNHAAILDIRTQNEVKGNSAVLTGHIQFYGHPEIYEYGFCWNQSGMPTINDNVKQAIEINECDDFSALVDELTPGTSYYFRAYAINDAGVSYSKQIGFMTQPQRLVVLEPPLVFDSVEKGEISEPIPYNIYWSNVDSPIILNSTNENFTISFHPDSSFVSSLTISPDQIKEYIAEPSTKNENLDLISNIQLTEVKRIRFLKDNDFDIIRTKEVQLNNRISNKTNVKRGDQIILTLFDDKNYTANVKRVYADGMGTVSILTMIEGFALSYAIITTNGKRSFVTISLKELNEHYRILSDPETNKHFLIQINDFEQRQSIASNLNLIEPESFLNDQSVFIHSEKLNKPDRIEQSNCVNDTTTVDVLFMSTPTVASWADSQQSGIENFVAQHLGFKQLALDNSETMTKINLVHLQVLEYDDNTLSENGNQHHLSRLRNHNGQLDETKYWRDFFGADFLTLLVHNTASHTWILKSKYGNSSISYSVIGSIFALFVPMANVYGPNWGLGLARDDPFRPGPNQIHDWPENNWSAAWQYEIEGANYGTICHWNNPTPFYSNPTVFNNDVPVGNYDSDNARTLRTIRHGISSHRPATDVDKKTVYVRFEPTCPNASFGSITHESYNTPTASIGLRGNAADLEEPTIFAEGQYLYHDNLSFGLVNVGECETKSYVLHGSNLVDGINVSAPPGFVVSLHENSDFQESLFVEHEGGTVEDTVYVKFCPANEHGGFTSYPFYETLYSVIYNGRVSHYSSGANDATLFLSGLGQIEPPSIFDLTGGGIYCSAYDNSGIIIELTNSEINTHYQLKRHHLPKGPAVAGTGEAIIWEDVEYGVYTVEATNGFYSKTMSGEIVVDEIEALPISVSISVDQISVCAGATVEYTAHPLNGGNNPQLDWMVNSEEVGHHEPVFFYAPVEGDSVTVLLTSSEECVINNPALSNPLVVDVYLEPDVIWEGFDHDTIYIHQDPILLTGGLPFGGFYEGSGVIEGYFHPDEAGLGSHTLTYFYIDDYECIGSASFSITVSVKTYNISISVLPDGSGYVEGYGSYAHFEEVTLTATPNTGYHFVEWQEEGEVVIDGDEPAGAVYTFIAEEDRDLVAYFAINTYILTYNAGENGSLIGETQQVVEHGSDGTPVEAIPDEGHHFTQWSDGLEDNPRTDINVTEDVSVTAQFEINTYTLEYDTDGNGFIEGEATQAVEHGSDGSPVEAIPEAGYYFVDWSDGVTDNPRTDENVTEDMSVTAHFALNVYTIEATAGDNGTITPEGDVEVTHGDDQPFTITPAYGYEVLELVIDGNAVDPVEEYVFENVTQNHTIHAEFTIINHIITATSTEGGSIDPEGDVVVDHGDNQLFTITPAEGYEILDVLVDGESIGAVDQYEFVNVIDNHTISAEFEIEDETGITIIVDKVSVYPNPFDNTVTISNAAGLTRLVIKNIFGQTVFENILDGSDELIINAESFTPGVYIFTLTGSDNSVRVLKMIKE